MKSPLCYWLIWERFILGVIVGLGLAEILRAL